MKLKLAIAAGLMATAGIASAQSSVTLYGIVDAGVNYYNNVKTGGSFTGMNTLTGEVPSRFGLKGVEDLGGGTSAIFQLENGFAIANGTLGYGSRLFGRQANVGLTNSQWGTVTVGRVTNMTFDSMLDSDVMGPNIYSTASIDAYIANARSDNAIRYMSPNMAGLRIGGTYSFGANASNAGGPSAINCAGQVAGDFQACKQYTALISYDFLSAFNLTVTYDKLNGNAGVVYLPISSPSYTNSHLTVNGYWKYSNGRVGAGWIHNTIVAGANGSNYDMFFVGVNYLLTPALSLDGEAIRYQLRAQSATSSTNASIAINGAGSANATMLIARATYSLSKRTSVYGQLGWVDNSQKGSVAIAAGGTGPVAGGSQFGADVGIQHRF